jgi:hypothetical protein
MLAKRRRVNLGLTTKEAQVKAARIDRVSRFETREAEAPRQKHAKTRNFCG